MGTFHNDKGELHGITVVVDMIGSKVAVGRCDEITPTDVVLFDVDVHDEIARGQSKREYLATAARFGVWKKHDRLVVPLDEVTSVTPLQAFAKTTT